MIFKPYPAFEILTDPATILAHGDAIVTEHFPTIGDPQIIVSGLAGRRLESIYLDDCKYRAVYRKIPKWSSPAPMPEQAMANGIGYFLPGMKHPAGCWPLTPDDIIKAGDFWYYNSEQLSHPATNSIGKKMSNYTKGKVVGDITGWPFRKLFQSYPKARKLPINPIFSRPLPLP